MQIVPTNTRFSIISPMPVKNTDHIEIIRGLGPVLWGSNSVSGLINVITKSAAETLGTLLSGEGGADKMGFGLLRYGGKPGDKILPIICKI